MWRVRVLDWLGGHGALGWNRANTEGWIMDMWILMLVAVSCGLVGGLIGLFILRPVLRGERGERGLDGFPGPETVTEDRIAEIARQEIRKAREGASSNKEGG